MAGESAVFYLLIASGPVHFSIALESLEFRVWGGGLGRAGFLVASFRTCLWRYLCLTNTHNTGLLL